MTASIPTRATRCRTLTRAAATTTLLLASLGAHAQSGSAPGQYEWEEFGKRVQASQKVTPLGPDLFGEQVSLSNGALSFSATDVSIPGNSGLRVAFSRSYTVKNWKDYATDGTLADWQLEAPSISGTFQESWNVMSGGVISELRCSKTAPPPQPFEWGFTIHDFWNSIQMSVPGGGGGELLKTNLGVQRPTDGKTYYWVTQGNAHVSCLPTIKNGTGEGFRAVTPDGTIYTFDWMAAYAEPTLKGQRIDVGSASTMTNYLHRTRFVMYATRVEDRFGNVVDYTYTNAWNKPAKLTKIAGNDGRQLTITYNGSNQVATVGDGTRTWTYTYASTPDGRKTLTQVTLPDASKWQYGFAALTDAEIEYHTSDFGEIWRTCTMNEIPQNYDAERVGTITHPSGAVGSFTVFLEEHGRSFVPVDCGHVGIPNTSTNDDINLYGGAHYAWTLKQKRITGPGLTTLDWNYSYEPNFSYYRYAGTTMINPVCKLANPADCGKPPCQSESCARSSRTTIAGPAGEWERHSYGNTYLYNEGKLLKVERGTGEANILSTVTNTYRLPPFAADLLYPVHLGSSIRMKVSDSWDAVRPLIQTTTTQQGATFNKMFAWFDAFARPTVVGKWSELGTAGVATYDKTEALQYHDNFGKWVLGLPQKFTVGGIVVGEATYDSGTAQQLTFKAFGELRQTLTYRPDGTVATVKDGRNFITSLNNWYRGVPQQVLHPDGTDQLAVVNGFGWLTSITNENDEVTGYGYDALGRIASITPPLGDGVAWSSTTSAFVPVSAIEYGLGAGHWKQTIARGNYRKVTYFDAMWRAVIEHEYDSANVAGTQRFTGWKYDHVGRMTFAGYPRSTASSIASFTTGTTTTFDPLGRTTKTSQSSEHGALDANYAYLTGFQTRVTNPRLYSTLTAYQAFDEPSTDAPVSIIAAEGQPEQITTTIDRDDLGKAATITRSGFYAGAPVTATRRYIYDAQQRLCKRIDPESGQTLFDYDVAGNVAWMAKASSLPNYTCDAVSPTSAARVDYTYDSRNRLTLTNYVDATTPDVTTDYYPDSSIEAVTMGPVTLSYEYNEIGKIDRERMQHGTLDWSTYHGYNAKGDVASVTYPDNHTVTFEPNALGQATQAGTYATGATYYPNGALKQFTYDNDLVHTLTQNVRGRPERSVDALASTVVLDDTYDYDFNGNVAGITDGLSGQPGNRDMSYDALDRLTGVIAGAAQGGNAVFAYDPLDNLRVADQGARQYRYSYGADNRLAAIKNPAGSTIFTFGFDGRGNQTSRTGATFKFNRAESLTSTSLGASSYVYDGLGRRVRATAGGLVTHSYYGSEGKLVYQQTPTQKLNHIYLAGSAVAERSVPVAGGTATTKFQHTDALGTPVAETDANRVVLARERMTAYGEPADGTYADGPGYTGHVTDAASKLTYMQQRYYDPAIGRFLSVDPMASDPTTGWNFSRYAYGGSSPYMFTDPDGRIIEAVDEAEKAQIENDINSQSKQEFKFNADGQLEATGNVNKITNSSQSYSDDIAEVIASSEVTKIDIAETYPGPGDTTINIDEENGGALHGNQGNDRVIMYSQNRAPKDRDEDLNKIYDSPADKLRHEITGHSAPRLRGQVDESARAMESVSRRELGKKGLHAVGPGGQLDPVVEK